MSALQGVRVALTRPLPQSAALAAQLRQQGAAVLFAPLLEIVPIAAVLAELSTAVPAADWVVWVSPSAIDVSWPAMAPFLLPHTRFATVGAASAKRLARYTSRPVSFPTAADDSEALLALPEWQAVDGKTVLLINGEQGRPDLALNLMARGAQVVVKSCYRRQVLAVDWPAWQAFSPQAVVVSSREIAQHLWQQADAIELARLQSLLFVVPHPRIGETLRQLGAPHVMVTRAGEQHTLSALDTWFRAIDDR